MLPSSVKHLYETEPPVTHVAVFSVIHERTVRCLTCHTMMIHYEIWNRKFRFLSLSHARHLYNILKINHTIDAWFSSVTNILSMQDDNVYLGCQIEGILHCRALEHYAIKACGRSATKLPCIHTLETR